jgi:H/ACA ribonucleoprotein complex subunit 1
MVKFMNPGRGGYNRPQREEGPPQELTEVGEVMHGSEENQLLCKATASRVPWYSKMVYLENKAEVGTVDEVLGPVSDFVRSI